MSKVFVTGSTGNIGYYVVKELIKRNAEVNAAVFHMEKGKEMFGSMNNVHCVQFDFLNPATYEKALQGVDKIFLMRPPQLANPEKDMLPFLTFAKEKNIKHIVFVSLLGVDKNPVVPHRKIEKFVKELGFHFTLLRPSFFMQNLNTTHKDDIQKRDELYMPVGKAKTSFIDTRDIGEIAAICLTESGHENKAYTLTGNEAIDYYQVADIMTKVLGRKITYKNPGTFSFRKTIIKRGTPKDFANVMTLLYLMTKIGTAKSITTDAEKILKRKTISFEQYVIDHQDAFM